MAVVVIALDGSFFDGSVHALDLPVGPGMVGFCQTMFDGTSKAEPIEGMAAPAGGWALTVFGQVGELDPLSVSTVWIR